MAIDFIGPLPEDEGFDCMVTMTDRTGSDVRVVPTRTDISAEDFAELFFDHWYCENGLPLDLSQTGISCLYLVSGKGSLTSLV